MRYITTVLLLLALCLGPAAWSIAREGGEDIDSAVFIPSLPYQDYGNTCDNLHNYDEVCPYTYAGTAGDVVYGYVATTTTTIHIDLCGSLYDTKVFVYENGWTPGVPHACNEDYYPPGDPCGDWNARLENMPITAGNTYYIVVKGYMGECGDYTLTVMETEACPLDCSWPDLHEGEPELVTDYVDTYNSGCGGEPNQPFQYIEGEYDYCATMCGVSGWYGFEGMMEFDNDWFAVVAIEGLIVWTIEAQFPVQQIALLPDCDNLQFLATAQVPACQPHTVVFPTQPGAYYWLWVSPLYPVAPPLEFDYVMEICGIMPSPIAVEQSSWGSVKNLYR